MAKPRPVTGIDPERRLRPNARRILRVRIDEVHAYGHLVTDPDNVTELHDMRIAFKRLRYLLEIFAVAFGDDLAPFIDEVKDMQEVLGEVHDCDVQIPLLQAHLARLEDDGRADGHDGAHPDERPGIHTLIGLRRQERVDAYRRFLVEWRRLEQERFRERLEQALGIA